MNFSMVVEEPLLCFILCRMEMFLHYTEGDSVTSDPDIGDLEFRNR